MPGIQVGRRMLLAAGLTVPAMARAQPRVAPQPLTPELIAAARQFRNTPPIRTPHGSCCTTWRRRKPNSYAPITGGVHSIRR